MSFGEMIEPLRLLSEAPGLDLQGW